jgi:COX assembly mitochondrial protein 2
MAALEECHAKGFMWKSLGMCNGAKDSLRSCLRQARVERQSENRSATQIKQDRIRAAWKEVDENS